MKSESEVAQSGLTLSDPMGCSPPGSSVHGICVCVGGVPLKGRYRTEGEMVGWHHQLNGHEFEQTLGDGEGQGNLVGCSSQGHKESDMTE